MDFKEEKITGIVEEVTFQNEANGFTVLDLAMENELLTVYPEYLPVKRLTSQAHIPHILHLAGSSRLPALLAVCPKQQNRFTNILLSPRF